MLITTRGKQTFVHQDRLERGAALDGTETGTLLLLLLLLLLMRWIPEAVAAIAVIVVLDS